MRFLKVKTLRFLQYHLRYLPKKISTLTVFLKLMVNHSYVYVCVLSDIFKKWGLGLLLHIYEEGQRKLY